MNASEIRKCDFCDQPISGNTREGKSLDFYRLVLEHHMLNVKSLQERIGLSLFVGSEQLAEVMGAPQRVSVCFARRELLICSPCMVEKFVNLLDLGDRGKELPADKVPA